MFADMLGIQVKASSITHLTDARYFAAYGVNYLGFVVEENYDGYIGVEKINEIKAWVEGPKTIGEINTSETIDVNEVIEKYALDGIHLGVFSFIDVPEDVFLIRDVLFDDIKNKEDLPGANIWVLKTNTPYAEACEKAKKLGIDPEQCLIDTPIIKEIDTDSKYGIIVRGSDEEKVGYKSYDGLDDIFESLMD